MPKTAEEWLDIANSFEKKFQFPHCVGAVGGKHVIIQATKNNMSEYRNYKGSHSVVLMGIVDSNYCFMLANTACGMISEEVVFQNINYCDLNLPSPIALLKFSETALPYVFVADDAFSLTNETMKPYPSQLKRNLESTFNERLSRANSVGENAFGLMASVFRILCKPLALQPEKVDLVLKTCVLLHNFLRRSSTSKKLYSPDGSLDYVSGGQLELGSWRQDTANITGIAPLQNQPNSITEEGKIIRNKFAEYFIS